MLKTCPYPHPDGGIEWAETHTFGRDGFCIICGESQIEIETPATALQRLVWVIETDQYWAERLKSDSPKVNRPMYYAMRKAREALRSDQPVQISQNSLIKNKSKT